MDTYVYSKTIPVVNNAFSKGKRSDVDVTKANLAISLLPSLSLQAIVKLLGSPPHDHYAIQCANHTYPPIPWPYKLCCQAHSVTTWCCRAPQPSTLLDLILLS